MTSWRTGNNRRRAGERSARSRARVRKLWAGMRYVVGGGVTLANRVRLTAGPIMVSAGDEVSVLLDDRDGTLDLKLEVTGP